MGFQTTNYHIFNNFQYFRNNFLFFQNNFLSVIKIYLFSSISVLFGSLTFWQSLQIITIVGIIAVLPATHFANGIRNITSLVCEEYAITK